MPGLTTRAAVEEARDAGASGILEFGEWFGEKWRRRGWFLENMTPAKLGNLCLAGAEYLTKRDRMRAWPVVVKIDISPLCNLKCTICVHADPGEEQYLQKQTFDSSQRMAVDQYRRIIDEIKGKSMAVSLYYLGDPLVHPNLDEMCGIARQAGLNVHISTNFSFTWNDDRIHRHVESGVTHLTVCVDGLSQQNYARTRVGGRIGTVLSNLERLILYRNSRKLRYPKVEVQYLVFDHNKDEMLPALELFRKLGVDQVVFREGGTQNWASVAHHTKAPKKNRALPQCVWPHFFMVVKYNGDVIPCCLHRVGDQYATGADTRAVGNAFQSTIREIWNSDAYRQLRRVVSNPTRAHAEPGSERGYCDACPQVYEVSTEQLGHNLAIIQPLRSAESRQTIGAQRSRQ